MHIQSNSPQIPQRLGARVQNENPQPPQQPKERVTQSESESFGQKAIRVLSKTAMGAGVGYVSGLVAQEPGKVGMLGGVYMTLHGAGAGCATGWHVGKRAGLAFASGQGNEYARGGLALLSTFGGPFVGAGVGAAAGLAAAFGGPLVGAAVFGSMALANELAR